MRPPASAPRLIWIYTILNYSNNEVPSSCYFASDCEFQWNVYELKLTEREKMLSV